MLFTSGASGLLFDASLNNRASSPENSGSWSKVISSRIAARSALAKYSLSPGWSASSPDCAKVLPCPARSQATRRAPRISPGPSATKWEAHWPHPTAAAVLPKRKVALPLHQVPSKAAAPPPSPPAREVTCTSFARLLPSVSSLAAPCKAASTSATSNPASAQMSAAPPKAVAQSTAPLWSCAAALATRRSNSSPPSVRRSVSSASRAL
mmetsp:Transcript_31238/g.70266  ORF Transcript_31238/g.70266 Transcript_31238/m.70266 type:complete len:209 (+) Transcript_31238:496-1122(+)